MGEEMVELYFAAVNDRNMEAVRNMVCEDTEWSAPGGVVLRGPDQVTGFLSAYLQAFPDARYDLIDYVVGDTTGAFEATLTGTHLGVLATPGGDIPPTGKAIRVPFAAIFNLKGGQISRKRIYFDLLGMLTELGVPGQMVEAP